MKCWRRGKPAAGSKQVHVNPSREGNGVQNKADKHGMERHGAKPPKPTKSGDVVEYR